MFRQLAATASAEICALQESLPSKILDIDAKLHTLSATSLADAEAAFAKALNPATPTTNATVAPLVSYARGEVSACVLNLRKIERWIALNVPRVEDGNNFGVAVQMEINKMVVEQGKKVKELFDKLADYHKERMALMKNVAASGSTETVEATSSGADDEMKAGEPSKSSKSSTSKSSTVKHAVSTPLPDAMAAVVAFDAHWLFQVYYTLEIVRDAYIICGDCVEKNKLRLEAPKGETGNSMSMF